MTVSLYLRQTIVNYAHWKEGFDTHLPARQAGGATAEALVLRNVAEWVGNNRGRSGNDLVMVRVYPAQ